MSIDCTVFTNSFGRGIFFQETIESIVSFVQSEPTRFYKVIIGSDTSASRIEPCKAQIITAVVVWRVGKGGIYYLTKSPYEFFHTRRERIIRETMSSLMLAQEVRSRLKDALGEEFLWDGNEIHADIGNGGDSRDFIREVTGLIKGFDFVPVIKPESWGASCVADKYT